MKIIYMHHAERDIGENHADPILRQEEDITERGIEETEILGKEFLTGHNQYKIKAIVTSTYKRCKHTAEIVNKYLNVPIIEDSRFDECNQGESFSDLYKRVMKGIDDITKKYTKEDDILIVTSGINLTGFICYFYNINPDDAKVITQGAFCSPINFCLDSSIFKSVFKEKQNF